jgi:pimeloyl-ACP methyl ester carboxylesterase
MSGQAYIEYQIPKNRTHPFPILMIEGGGQSGSNFTGTPDGREGWAQFFLKRGYAVYVMDQPGRGRSALRPDYGDTVQRPTSWVQQQFTAPERSKLWPQARLHTQWPGTGMAGDPIFDQFYAQQLQAIASFPKQQELNRDAGAALLDKIGPAILLTHSQSGAFGWPIADARPNLVKAIVAVEPSGPPVHDGVFKGAPDFFDNGPLSKPWGIAAVPLAYGGVTEPSQLAFTEQEKADAPDLMKCWRQKEPARSLTNLRNIPVVIISSEASYHASYDHCTAQYLTQAGVKNSFIRLADGGIRGNGHMMMLEKNNLQIAAVIEDWLRSTLH